MRSVPLLLVCALPACVDGLAPVDEVDPAAPAGLQAVYVVGEGDTLAAIARRFAVPGGWRALAAANHLLDPDHVEAAQGLLIPVEGLLAQGHDPFSLHDDVELIPRLPPVELPRPEPVASVDDDWSPAADTADGCGGRHHHLPVSPEALRDPAQPACAAVGGRWLCVADAGASGGADEVELIVDDTVWLTMPYGWLSPLEVVEVDLDGDGRDELLLSELRGVSNGAAIATYQLAIAPGPGAPAHTFTTAGWALVATDDGCALDHQTFESIDDPVEGSGNYDVTRTLVWRGDTLRARGDRIHGQRWRDQPPQLRPEPLLAGQVLTRRTGTVVAFDGRGDGQRALTLDLGGERVTLTEPRWDWSDDEAAEPEAVYAGLGWADARVLLPADLRPPPAVLLGRDATIETRLTWPGGALSQVVWLTP